MKRSLSSSSSSSSIILAPLSQASVRGAEQACTAIAVVACSHRLFPRSTASLTAPAWMELCIRQGGALYTCWGRAIYANAKEMVELASPALPIILGAEFGGGLWQDSQGDDGNVSLLQAVGSIKQAACAVLTIGAFSVALFLHDNGSAELFNSHAAVENQQFGALYHFESRDNLIGFLRERFPVGSVAYSLSIVRNRMHLAPPAFPLQSLAFEQADRLPFGFFYVFAHDIHKSGSKEYLVAGLEDFYNYYSNLEPAKRSHYDMARDGCPVTLYLDLEFETFPENSGCNNGREMLADMLKLVASEANVLAPLFRVTDSSTREAEEEEDGNVPIPMSVGDDNLRKVSYHVHHQGVWFRGTAELGTFMTRVEQQAQGSLRVMRLKRETLVEEFFADQTVYTSNRCFRFVYSSKLGSSRRFIPLDADAEAMDDAAFFGAILSPPAPQLYSLLQQAVSTEGGRGEGRKGGGEKVMPLSTAPLAIRTLAAEIERHYQPQCMRGFQLNPTGLVTFSMVKHDCDICNDTHNNQVYVVADLKSRVFYSKCHADRSKTGPEVAFPASLGPLSMAILEEMQPGERASVGIFPASSYTAHMVLGFAGAIFGSARTAPQIPNPGSVSVLYNKIDVQYEVHLPGKCVMDMGNITLQISVDKLVIRCKGDMCKEKGKRWERPSHSASSAGRWQLLFLFPEAAAAAAAAAVALVASSQSSFLPDMFLAEPNFLRALGFDGRAPLFMYDDRLKQIEEWTSLTQKAHGSTVHELACAVRQKAHIIRGIFGTEMMEVCYRECLAVAPDFVYPITLLPRSPSTLALAMWIHLAQQRGYKRVENDFYIPVTDEAGRTFYRAVHMDQLMTSVCTFKLTPNLCAAVFWNGRTCDDLKRLLADQNQFPSLSLSKRYLGYTNVVYDLEKNVTLTWDDVRADPSIMPFNFLEQNFPAEMLERAKATCPSLVEGEFVGAETFEPATPLFDGPLKDQEFTLPTVMWLYALIGRMFHYVGKRDGDNWEVIVFLMGAPGSFKSSIIAIIQKYMQASQLGILGTRVEVQFPIDELVGKLMAFMSECGGCTLERDLLKQMASGDSVRVYGKYKTAVNVANWNIPLLFAGNAFLNVVDTDGSLCRRVALFPFLHMLREGQGVTDLADRIFRDEGPLLLIKWNTLYLKLRSSINTRIQSLLPSQVREATRQAVMAGDSFKTFFAQEIIVTGSSNDRIPWIDVLKTYQAWCKMTGRKAYVVDPTGVEEQAMLRGFGVRLSRHTSPVSVVKARPRRSDDTPFRNVLEVMDVRRGGEEEEESGSSEVPMDEEDE
jgi:hypothetical protein